MKDFDKVIYKRDEIKPKFKYNDIVKIKDEGYTEYNGKIGRVYISYLLQIIGKSTEDYPNGYAIRYDVFVGDNNYTTPILEKSLVKGD